MTRETKIGMVVAGSFLSLVGVVVGTKMYRRDVPENKGPETPAAVAELPKNPAPSGSPSVTTPPGLLPAGLRSTGQEPFPAPPSSSPSGVASLPPLPPPSADPTSLPAIPAATSQQQQLNELIERQKKELRDRAGATTNGSNGVNPSIGEGIASLPAVPGSVDPLPTPPLTSNPPLLPPVSAPPSVPPTTPAMVVAQGSDTKKPTSPPSGLDLPPVPGVPAAPPIAAPSAPPPPVAGPSTPAPIAGLPPAPPGGSGQLSPVAPAPPSSPPAPVTGRNDTPPPPIGAIPAPPTSPPSGAIPAVPPVPGAGDPLPAPPSAPPMPPGVGVTSPPAVAPLVPPVPSAVVVGEERTHLAKPNESYVSIAHDVYGDDRFAPALEAYNRSRLGAGASATLRPGDTVVVPTAETLRNSRFASLIATNPSTSPIPPPAPPFVAPSPPSSPPLSPPIGAVPAAPPFPGTSPMPPPIAVVPPPPPGALTNRDPVTIGTVTAPDPTRPATTPVPAGVTTYRIPSGGLLIAQVAQQQLGSPLRWIDIYRLNSNLDPSRPIPEGTEIRLPPR